MREYIIAGTVGAACMAIGCVVGAKIGMSFTVSGDAGTVYTTKEALDKLKKEQEAKKGGNK